MLSLLNKTRLSFENLSVHNPCVVPAGACSFNMDGQISHNLTRLLFHIARGIIFVNVCIRDYGGLKRFIRGQLVM